MVVVVVVCVARVRQVMVVVVAIGADAAHYLHPFGPVALIHGAELVSAAAHSVRANGLQFHAYVQTLLEATVRTSFPLGLVDVTTAIGHTRVDLLVLDRALEEALAALAGQQTVVIATVLDWVFCLRWCCCDLLKRGLVHLEDEFVAWMRANIPRRHSLGAVWPSNLPDFIPADRTQLIDTGDVLRVHHCAPVIWFRLVCNCKCSLGLCLCVRARHHFRRTARLESISHSLTGLVFSTNRFHSPTRWCWWWR